MELKSVNQAAEILGINVRTVQKWCKDGKLKGAVKMGRDWMIPANSLDKDTPLNLSNTDKYTVDFTPLPLFNHSFPSGGCIEYINSIKDNDRRNVAMGEYHYYRGEFEKATQYMEPYLNHENTDYCFTASLISSYANLAETHINISKFSFRLLANIVEKEFRQSPFEHHKALAIWTDTTVATQFQYPIEKISVIDESIRHLPQGQKIFGCYLMAYRAYLEKDYNRALGIADTALVCSPEFYPMPTAYIYIISAIALLNLMRIDEAKQKIEKAWSIVEQDGLIIPFIEHYSLLNGMVDIYFKKSAPEIFQKILTATKKFNSGWYKEHNEKTGEYIADNLTTTEFTIAMLYNKGWRIKEIAAHIELSERTVKNYIQIVYEKLGISGKRELDKYMMK